MTHFRPDCHYGSVNSPLNLLMVWRNSLCLHLHICYWPYHGLNVISSVNTTNTDKNFVTISQRSQRRIFDPLLTGMWFYPCGAYQAEGPSRMRAYINQATRQHIPCNDDHSSHHTNFKSYTVKTLKSSMYVAPHEHLVTNWKTTFIGFITKDEAYLFYIRTQRVLHCKHSPLQL
jgi:hypothetical protein